MNAGFYEDLDTNFEQAYMLANKTFSHDELVNMLKTGNIPQKQIASLKFDYVKSKEDAECLLNNLTGCDGIGERLRRLHARVLHRRRERCHGARHGVVEEAHGVLRRHGSGLDARRTARRDVDARHLHALREVGQGRLHVLAEVARGYGRARGESLVLVGCLVCGGAELLD